MGKVNIITVLTVIALQLVTGYVWYGSTLFGDTLASSGGPAISVLKTDVLSLILAILAGYGLTFITELLVKTTGVKDIGEGLKLGLKIGFFGLGLPTIMLLNLLGFGKVTLLVVFGHLVLTGLLSGAVVTHFKKS